MSKSRLTQVWLGILGIVAGVSVILSGVMTAEPQQKADNGISITVVHTATTK